MIYFIIIVVALFFVIFNLATNYTKQNKTLNPKNKKYFPVYLALWSLLPSSIVFIFSYLMSNYLIHKQIFKGAMVLKTPIANDTLKQQIIQVANQLKQGVSPNALGNNFLIDKAEIINFANKYLYYDKLMFITLFIIFLLMVAIISFVIIKRLKLAVNLQKRLDKLIQVTLFLFSTIAILATISIIVSLFLESLQFFKHVSVFNFLFRTVWAPQSADADPKHSFGVIPLLSGTLLIAFIAVVVATIIGVLAAIYMAEYMPAKLRKVVKPALEILAGIPSIVYGFFAAITFAPFVVRLLTSWGFMVSSENALSAGIVMGIMIIPLISSISDDVINAVPKNIKEGAIGLGSLKYEMILHIVLPAALPGILGSILLAVSRAIGETMIVIMASSLAANLTLNPLKPVTTITTQIVMLIQGDQEFNSPKTLSAFALGFLLLILTLILNLIAARIVSRYKAKYHN